MANHQTWSPFPFVDVRDFAGYNGASTQGGYNDRGSQGWAVNTSNGGPTITFDSNASPAIVNNTASSTNAGTMNYGVGSSTVNLNGGVAAAGKASPAGTVTAGYGTTVTGNPFFDIPTMRTFLNTNFGATYTAAQLDKMTANDMVFAIRCMAYQDTIR
jgi:hypothetical protein